MMGMYATILARTTYQKATNSMRMWSARVGCFAAELQSLLLLPGVGCARQCAVREQA